VIDTGRLHEETLDLLEVARGRYGLPIRVYRPLDAAVADFVRAHGLNGFYDGVAERHLCCGIARSSRSAAPSPAATPGSPAAPRPGPSARRCRSRRPTPTGARQAQPARASGPNADVLGYVERHAGAVNALHARGYPSIGCEPCTRAVRPGEDPRAGRWWWERGAAKECGLHLPRIVVEPAACA
jgi:phosphoadenosine phosphosulfate reductase